MPGVVVLALSRCHETAPVGGPSGQIAYLNAVAELATTLTAHELLSALQTIEARFGRERDVRWGPRTLDLDLLIFGEVVANEPELELPHPRMTERRFVLEPLAEIAPELIEPVSGLTIAELLSRLKLQNSRDTS